MSLAGLDRTMEIEKDILTFHEPYDFISWDFEARKSIEILQVS
jgi:hypothetical protein